MPQLDREIRRYVKLKPQEPLNEQGRNSRVCVTQSMSSRGARRVGSRTRRRVQEDGHGGPPHGRQAKSEQRRSPRGKRAVEDGGWESRNRRVNRTTTRKQILLAPPAQQLLVLQPNISPHLVHTDTLRTALPESAPMVYHPARRQRRVEF